MAGIGRWLALALVLAAGVAWAQGGGGGGGGGAGGSGGSGGGPDGAHQHRPAAAAEPASTQAFRAANAKMHRDMDIRYTGDADRDFVAGMLAHHQGAIDMALAVIRHGKDPEIRRLAQDIVTAQGKEIAQMRVWLAKQR